MKCSQKIITDFFKPKRKSQSLITDYFKPSQSKKRKNAKLASNYNPRIDYKYSRLFLAKNKSFHDAASTRLGYFFCATRNFSEYHIYTTSDKLIHSGCFENFIPKGTCIASAMIDEGSALEHISVHELFRRQGLGKKLIAFINKHAPQFHIFGGIENNSRYRLTEEGAALIRACEKSGILQHEQIIQGTVPGSQSY